MSTPINIAVIGHTNVGKTSLLRTLTRNQSFGDVQNSAATTRHVEMSQLQVDSVSIQLFDTPGLEDASSVMDYLIEYTDVRADGVTRLQAFCQAVTSDERLSDYAQETKVVNALMNADLALYVIDAREPVLSKYQDELAIVAWSGVPVLPVFNFISASDNLDTWRQILARRGLHVVSMFDTVAYNFENEIKLWQSLLALSARPEFSDIISVRKHDWLSMLDEGRLMIADFLINVATFCVKIGEDDDPAPCVHAMQEAVRTAELHLQTQLLHYYRFYNYPIASNPLKINASVSDPFAPDQLVNFGIRTATGGTIGAIIGAGIDALTLGASLGLGTLTGGFAGGVLSNTQSIKDKINKQQTLIIDDNTLLVLANRACLLHHQLRHTGHATIVTTSDSNEYKNRSSANNDLWSLTTLPKTLAKARKYTHYSSLVIDPKNPNKSHKFLAKQKNKRPRTDLAVLLADDLPPND